MALTLFVLASLTHMIIMVMLSHIIMRKFKNDLINERNRLLVCQLIFCASFFLRAILIGTVLSNIWYEFTYDYECNMTNRFKTAMLPLQFIFYNVIPYMTLMYLHQQSFKPHKDTISVDDTVHKKF